MLTTLLCHLAAAPAPDRPNIVFMHVESTDGRLYRPDTPVPIPNIHALMDRGVSFDNHYVNSPICAPSRSSMWSGRQPHNVPHMHNGIEVGGSWNNYEGVGQGSSVINGTYPGVNEQDLIGPALQAGGYTALVTGKKDWVAGGHSLLTMVDSWSIYARFPYSQPEQGGFHVWGDCGGNLTVEEGQGPHESAHAGDWRTVDSDVAWLGSNASESQPFFLFAGLNIVHPPYQTTQKYLDRIDRGAIRAPDWRPLSELHPCDLQTTLKKGCALPSGYQNTSEYKSGVIAGCPPSPRATPKRPDRAAGTTP